jgi:SAM-dependent methyltransferase
MQIVDRCPICSTGSPIVVAELDSRSRSRFLEYSQRKYGGLIDRWAEDIPPKVVRCVRCTHYWYRNQPEPEELAAMYAAARGMRRGNLAPLREAAPPMIAEMRRFRRLFVAGERPTLLDYGSGHGRWARAAVTAGFAVTAFEPSVERGAESDVPFELVHDMREMGARRFDAVQLEQVLEHVPDPLAVLREVRRYCGPDTLLRVTVPNATRAPEGRAIWRVWPFDGDQPHTLAPFEHLHGFTPESLRVLLARAGYTPLSPRLIWTKWPKLAASVMLGRLGAKTGSTGALVRPSA